jgi:O-6-methylguanine DNA methyltransferase
MTCEQAQQLLAQLIWPQVQTSRYAALYQHVQHCDNCQPYWQQWRQDEEQLTTLLAVESAPAGLWEHVMTTIQAEETYAARGDIWRSIALEVSLQGIQRLVLQDAPQAETTLARTSTPTADLWERALTQLAEYFQGERTIFQLPVDLHACTPFERDVLAATATIPYGEVRSYKWLAERVGRPGAARAIGNALHKNPVPVIIPCHRIVKTDGSLGGYAFGTAWKTRLLALEQTTAPFVGCSSTRILCYRGCRHERRVQEGNRIHFASWRDALEVGYRPCKVCQPAYQDA